MKDRENEVTEMGPVYAAPRDATKRKEDMALSKNICYLTATANTNKVDQ